MRMSLYKVDTLRVHTFPSQLFTNRYTTKFEYHSAGRYTVTKLNDGLTENYEEGSPSCPEFECTFTLTHTSLIALFQGGQLPDTFASNRKLCTFWHTGMSGNTLMYTFAPLIVFIFLFIASSALVSCFAVRRTPLPLIRMPHSPNANVVPFVDPPIGTGMMPL